MKDEMLGERIAAERKARHMTQAELGAIFGISDKAVSKWERNLSRPDERFMPQLVELLGLPDEYLPTPSDVAKEKGVRERLTCADVLRVICTSGMLAFGVGASTGLLAVDLAAPLAGICGGLFALTAMWRTSR